MGWTPFHYVGLVADIKTAEVLIKLGADINAKDNHGSSPLLVMLACLEHRRSALVLPKEDWLRLRVDSYKLSLKLGFIGWLVSHGGDIYVENSTGFTPLSLTMYRDLRRDMIFLTRRSLLVVFVAVTIADGPKRNHALTRVAGNPDLGRHIAEFL